MPSLKPLIAVTLAEATSWIGLLIAMFFKYVLDMDRGVQVMGQIHGFLFIAFVAVLGYTHLSRKWPLSKTLIAFLESIPPFLGFVLARQLLDEQAREAPVTR